VDAVGWWAGCKMGGYHSSCMPQQSGRSFDAVCLHPPFGIVCEILVSGLDSSPCLPQLPIVA